jgi:RND family efflux transporter MFP subunit
MKSNNQADNSMEKADRVRQIGVLLVAAAFTVLVLVFVGKKISFAREARQRLQDINAGPQIEVATVATSAPEQTLTLLGEARSYQEVTLYAKVSGFLRDVRVDKGDSVEDGELLARIESPETNQQYDAALADARNKQAIAERYKPLLERKLVSQQEADQAFADANVAQANLASLGAIKGYQELRAPFAGTVTARFADPGTLIQNAANAQSGAQPVFTVSQVGRLRVYAYVDQKFAASIHNKLPVHITLQERPDVQLDAAVTRFSGELDDKTRMLLVEVDLDNSHGQIVPGSYVQVSMKVQSPSYLEVPVEALILKDAKDYIPVVTSSNTITYRPVTLADNDGQHVKVLTGLEQGEMVALNLGNSLDEGSRVQPIAQPAPASAAPAK